MDEPISVLVVAADPLAAQRLSQVLQEAEELRFEVSHFGQVEEALESLQESGGDVLLLDLSPEEAFGLEPLYRAQVAANAIPIVVLTYQGHPDLALKAARAGAQDYLIKGEVTPALITRTLMHAVERHRMLQELREAQQQQHHLATHDPLTGLQNRYALLASLASAIADAKRYTTMLAVLFIDLDGFKPVNDNLGHAIGDELLADVAGRLRRLTRKSDHCARLGGDEFVIVARNLRSFEAPVEIAEQIRAEIEKPYYLADHEYWLSASIGVSMYPKDGDDAESLTRKADTAMYESKAAGRNAVSVFADTMDEEAEERFALVNGLREAIHRGDLLLDFQPQVHTGLETIYAAETLVRWNHPTRGIVQPAEFIGIAEQSGMMIPLGEWVLRTACGAAARWNSLPDLRVAVNVSGRQLEQVEFPDRIASILRDSGLPTHRLEIELTESLAAGSHAIDALHALRELGVRIAIDDFGTGYSSFSRLKQLPLDALKVDQVFIRDAVVDGAGAVILEAIIGMARGLGLDVVAEGVETVEEMDLLLGLGCHKMQGYLFSKPVPRQDFEQSITADDAAWRLPIARPETWAPPSPSAEPEPESVEDVSDDELPAFRR